MDDKIAERMAGKEPYCIEVPHIEELTDAIFAETEMRLVYGHGSPEHIAACKEVERIVLEKAKNPPVPMSIALFAAAIKKWSATTDGS